MNSNSQLKKIDKTIRRLNHQRKQLCKLMFLESIPDSSPYFDLDVFDLIVFDYINIPGLEKGVLSLPLKSNVESESYVNDIFKSIRRNGDTRSLLIKYQENIRSIKEQDVHLTNNITFIENKVTSYEASIRYLIRLVFLLILLFIFYKFLGLFWNNIN